MSGPKAQLEIAADASGVEAGVAKAKRSLADLGATAATQGQKAAEGIAAAGKGADDVANKVSASGARVLKSLESQSNRLTLTAAEYAKLRAETAGVAEAAAPFIAKIEAATQPLGKLGVSAAQTAAAMRGVPAQFTDIITSLQGGQQPITVLLQQGGQLKDMFGGLGPAARALGGYVASLVNPFTIAAAAAGVLALAYYQATQRTQEFNKALINSGNYAGQTAGGLDELSKKIASTIGTQTQASDALTSLAASGKIAGDSLQNVGTAVVAQNKAMGTSIEDAVAQYAKLADEPVKGSAKLNESLHYLNQTTYDRIAALEDQGRHEEAVALAQNTLATATISRMQQIITQSGYLSQALSGVAKVATGMWQAVAGGLAAIGQQQTVAEKLIDAQRKLNFLQQNGSTPQALSAAQSDVTSLARQSVRQSDNAEAEGARARAEQAKIAASQRLADQKKATRDRADQRKDEIDQLKRDADLVGLSKDQYDKRAAAINDKYKDPKGPKAPKEKAFQDDAATKFIEQLKQTEASLGAQLDGEQKLTAEQKKQVEFGQLIADLKEKKILTAEQKSLLANEDAIKAQLAKNVALSDQLELDKKIGDLVKKAADDATAFRQQIEGINISLAAAAESRSEQNSRALDAFGLGDRARQQVEAQRAIRNESDRFQRQLTKQASDKGQLGSDEYRDEVAKIKAALDDALSAQTAYFDALKSKQADWKTGATTALANYTDAINNVSETTNKAFTDGFKGAEDALVDFVTTGKGSFSSLANSIIKDLARIAIQKSITGPLASSLLGLLQGGGSGNTDWVTAAGQFGGFLTGNGIEGFASGGNPPVGKVSLVGEKGPELFVPNVAGTIVPNGAMGGAPVYLTINNTVGDVATMSMLKAAQAGTERRIAAALDRSQRYGGRLSQ